jgi:hypothetical protein
MYATMWLSLAVVIRCCRWERLLALASAAFLVC